MPVSLISEQSGHIACYAYANATDKDSAMTGDGSVDTPYDCVQEALEALTNIGAGNVSVTRLSVGTVSRARALNVATIETDAPHGLAVDDIVSVLGLGGANYNHEQRIIVEVPNSTTFTYASMESNEGTTADTDGTVARYRLYDIEFQGALAATNIDTLIPFSALTGGVSPDITVNETQQGDTGVNEVQRVRLNGLPTAGTFQLTYTVSSYQALEVSMAMRWVLSVLASDTVITSIIPASDHLLYAVPDKLFPISKSFIVVKPIDTSDSKWVSRIKRSKAANYIQVKVFAPETYPKSKWRTEQLARRLSDIFEHHINQPVTGGQIISCVRKNQIAASEDRSGQQIINLGVLLQINVTQT